MARGGGMQEVELLDGDEPVSEPGPEHVEAPARARRGRRWIVVGVAAVALSLVATQWVVDARERAAVARLAAVPGVLPEIGDELTVVRTIARADINALWGGIEGASGAASSLAVAADGSQAFVGIHPDTGETLFSTPLLGPNPERAASLENSFGGSCQSDVGQDEVATVAVCLVTDGFTRYSTDGDGGDEVVPATTSRAVVLDPDDGRVLAERPVEADARVAVLAEQLLVGTRGPDRVDVVAYDLRTGEERWAYDEVRDDGEDPDAQDRGQYWNFFRAGDVVVFTAGSGLGMLSATGVSVRDDLRTTAGGGGYGTDAAGNLVIFDYGSVGAQSTRLVAADGDPAADVVLEGALLHFVVDDGSVPGLALTSDGQARGWDRTTGDLLWETDSQDASFALVVRGRVYLTTATGLAALDGRTGDVVWEQKVSPSSLGSLGTDGRDLLVSTAFIEGVDDDDGSSSGGMTGYDLATGEKTRFIPYPEGVFDVQSYRGMVIGWSPTTDETFVLE